MDIQGRIVKPVLMDILASLRTVENAGVCRVWK